MKRKMNRLSIAVLLMSALGASSSAFADDSSEVMTGDPALACEAIMCLSSGTRPDECSPSLNRYFGINYKYWSDTVKGRQNFLGECPAAQDTSSANMPALVSQIAQGAGKCNAAFLNATDTTVVQKLVCPVGATAGSGDEGNDSCYYQPVTVISSTAPGYCVSYENNELTYLLGVTYEGDQMNGGHWVDDASAAGTPVN